MLTLDHQTTDSLKRRLTTVALAVFWAVLCAVLTSELTELVTDTPWIRALVAAATLLIFFPLFDRDGNKEHRRNHG